MAPQETADIPESLSPELSGGIVRRLVPSVSPRKIVLFGSSARGTPGPHSDVDILIVMPDGVRRGETSQRALRALHGIGVSKGGNCKIGVGWVVPGRKARVHPTFLE
jgi:tRNA nucleotidyltransferase (CCA-adding enzyme)